MDLLRQTGSLIRKEFLIEWRQRYALNGILIYVVATVFVVYISFLKVEPATWNLLFWIILLFAAVNAIAKSFVQENAGRMLYYYTLAAPQAIILAKMLYNMILMLVLAATCLLFYSLLVGYPVVNHGLFGLAVALGSIGFSLTFTMIAAIASKANSNATLMAILSFPVIIPMLLMLIRISKASLQESAVADFMDETATLVAIEVIIITLAFLLFPYLWRD